MRSFTTADLNKQVGEVTDAAQRAPVIITRRSKPRFVLMSLEHYEALRGRDEEPAPAIRAAPAGARSGLA